MWQQDGEGVARFVVFALKACMNASADPQGYPALSSALLRSIGGSSSLISVSSYEGMHPSAIVAGSGM
eukprot:jgi/Botrbrau1/9952/Bobra.0012s0047.1